MSFKLMSLELESSFIRGWDTQFIRLNIKRGEKQCSEILYIELQVAIIGSLTISVSAAEH